MRYNLLRLALSFTLPPLNLPPLAHLSFSRTPLSIIQSLLHFSSPQSSVSYCLRFLSLGILSHESPTCVSSVSRFIHCTVHAVSQYTVSVDVCTEALAGMKNFDMRGILRVSELSDQRDFRSAVTSNDIVAFNRSDVFMLSSMRAFIFRVRTSISNSGRLKRFLRTHCVMTYYHYYIKYVCEAWHGDATAAQQRTLEIIVCAKASNI